MKQVETRAKTLIEADGLLFKDLDGNGILDPYEDWRLPVNARVEDLLTKMTLEEKVGMMLINTLNANSGGHLPEQAVDLIRNQKMTRFIFRNSITPNPIAQEGGPGWRGAEITAFEAAQFMNSVQELAESTRLGIPLLFKSNARNHLDPDARVGINVSAGSFSEWPKEAGLAATRDMELIAEFAQTIRKEWRAIGLRGLYGYMADLATEPRWYRIHETFTEDADLAAKIMTVLVENLQGTKIGPDSIVLTMKHFPGGGPQEGGGDPHYDFGKNQIYPTGNFNYHYRPFKAAINAGLAAIMPYYGIPVDQGYEIRLAGESEARNVGMAFSRGILTELLRQDLGFNGVVNSDTGIIGDCTTGNCRAWGLEDQTVDQQIVIAIEAGTDVLSGFNNNAQILKLVEAGQISETRIDESVRRLLKIQFELGLFENPYVDPNRAAYLLGNVAFQSSANIAQRKSIVLLQNNHNLLPLPSSDDRDPVSLYTMGIKTKGLEQLSNYRVVSGDYDATSGETRPDVPKNTDYAILRIRVSNKGADRTLMFGGANPDELDLLSFSEMASAQSWTVEPPLEDIQAIMNQVGADKTVLSIYFRQPYVLDEMSGLCDAGALLATFGVSDAALIDVLLGNFAPQGKLPFALANSAEAILNQASDTPGYKKDDTLFPFGHGLMYS